jgi:glycosyltransferase involved in cell wall biosynthesis
MMMPFLCMIGPQPPPRHGVSAVNEAVLALTSESGLNVKYFNTSPFSLNRNIFIRVARLWPVVRAVFGVRAIVRKNSDAVVYCSVSGGFGILGELPIVWVARRHNAQVVLHHHSFRYLDRPFVPMRWLARIAGPTTIHVVLSANMEQILRSRYPQVQQTLVISNAAFINQASAPVVELRSGCRVIGHLSNLSQTKGIFEVVELAEWAEREKLDFEFRIAGPFEDKNVRREFNARTSSLKNIRYLGPLYGEEKQRFFEDLDAFVFPTQYRNEAEPKVLLEALSHGCPVISYDRGCISALIDPACGVLLPREAAFLPTASATLRNWQADNMHKKRRHAAIEKFAKLLDDATASKQMLLHILWGNNEVSLT